MSDPDNLCHQINHSIDDLMLSFYAMHWTSTAAEDTEPTVATTQSPPHGWEPADCRARFDALYESIDAFAGAVNDRMHAFSDRIEAAFADPGTAKERASTGSNR